MARDGRLLPTDLVHRDGMSTWVRAGTVRGLFVAANAGHAITSVGAHKTAPTGPAVTHVSHGAATLAGQRSLLADVPPAVRVALGLFVAGSILFAGGLVWYVRRAEHMAAIARCEDACEQAEAWLSEASNQRDPVAVARALTESLGQPGLPQRTKQRAKDVLGRVKKREAENAAERIFEAAEKAITAKKPGEAKKWLEEYMANGHGARLQDARQLFDEIEEATVESRIVAALAALPDNEFEQVALTGALPDGPVSRPELIEVRPAAALSLVPQARLAREQKQQMLASERRRRNAAIAERAADETVATLGAGLAELRRNAPPGSLQSPLFAFDADVQEQLKRDLKKRLLDIAGDLDIADGVERKMLVEAKRWIAEIQLRLQAEVRDATRSRASKITPNPVPAGSFRRHFESLSKKTDINSLRSWGNLKVLIARHGLSLEDIDWGEWHLANKTPMQDFSPEELEKYRRYLQLAAAGAL